MSAGINKFETYSQNPFRIEHKHIRNFDRKLDGVVVGKEANDMQEHIRIFPEMHADIELLSSMGMRILVYIFSQLKKDSDEVYFDMDEFIRFTNRGKIGEDKPSDIKNKAGIYRGISDLLEKNLIARKSGDMKVFYINPAKFYPGTRRDWYQRTKEIPMTYRHILVDARINEQKGNW